MGKTTGIEWAEATWNPWYGCRKVSPACAHCYAEREMTRYGKDFNRVTRAKDASFFAPLRWKEPRRIFTCSWSDFFIEEADAWRAEAWNVIAQTPRHTYMVLTKRIDRLAGELKTYGPRLVDVKIPANAWMGASVETMRQEGRVAALRKIEATVRFLSIEPMLGPMHRLDLEGIDLVIVGTESGSGARPTDLMWIRELQNLCKSEQVAFFVKQLTTPGGRKIPFEQWPEDLKIREIPHDGKAASVGSE
jgi:protein gp37